MASLHADFRWQELRRHPAVHGHRPQLRDGRSTGWPIGSSTPPIRAPPAAICRPAFSACAQVAAFAAACAVGFVASTLLFLPNRLPLYLSVPVLAFLAGYSYAKRFTSLAHFWLGTALALSPVAAWIAIRGDAVLANPADLLPALVLGGAVLTWVAGFDIIYACQDYDADRAGQAAQRARARSAFPARCAWPPPATWSRSSCWPACRWCIRRFGWIYWAGIAAVAVLLVYEHSLVRPDDLSRVNAAFFQRQRGDQPGPVCGWHPGPAG